MWASGVKGWLGNVRGKRFLLLIALMLGAALAGGCASDSGSSSSSGGSSGSSSCDQSCQDEWSGYGIIKSIWTMHNQIIAGNVEGTQSESGNCALGGSDLVTGSIDAPSVVGIETLNLSHQLASCGNAAASKYSLTLTGSVAQSGTFYTYGTSIAMNFSSSSLAFKGTVLDSTDVNDTCSFSATETSSGVSGTICGRTFAY
jgi:hypothetical protein